MHGKHRVLGPRLEKPGVLCSMPRVGDSISFFHICISADVIPVWGCCPGRGLVRDQRVVMGIVPWSVTEEVAWSAVI